MQSTMFLPIHVVPPMLRFHSLTFLLVLGMAAKAQCEFVGVSVSASDTGLVQLYHPGFFFFGATPNVGGYDNVCYWTIYDMEGDVLHEAETSGEWETQSFMLFEHDVPVTDSMRVEIVLTSPLEDFDCCVSDTLIWEETQSPLGNSAWGDWSTETDGYTEGVECGGGTAVKEGVAGSRLKVYPQPVDGAFRMEGLRGGETVTILNAAGRKVAVIPVVSPQQSFDTPDLPEGLYFVRVATGSLNRGEVHRLLKVPTR